MDSGLDGKVAMVTGAGRGIGAAIARTLAREGCDVCLVDIDAEGSIEDLAAEIRTLGRRAFSMKCDVADFDESERAVERTVEEFGALDILVCNAGIARDAVVWKMQEDEWDDVLAVNLKGCFTLARAAIPVMRKRGWGRVVTVSSINGLRGKFGQTNYAASKAGLIGFMKSLAREVGAFGITANVVAPGMVMTEMALALPDDVVEDARSDGVLGRLAEPSDVAESVAFLSSERARCITGEVLRVDSGQYI